ncbi:substrate-binding periplasmic protein [Pseudoalteromonas denitrificans]|uniref:Amino acid ABC transporter substrate-binding protein, PAAT family n=1 Tax=Pseudoalteromonas denitrificans DSM 6059 TaxID=1123010 RepID=A0A1I1N497_9GAMM|nr:transporter substrate-binding domain-containing protein [Pseudoalteromonas denitrificans]SFC92494.1 amino acid ABC transporter substrate-binding protein, PAAT family [Pseudoalteromonas denitrificans DSM 6059]
MKITFLFGFVLLVFSSTALGQFIYLVSTEFPPYVYEENERIKGFNVDLIEEIFKRMNVPIEIHLVPWARAVKMIKDGTADGLFPFFKSVNRLKFTDYSDAYTSEDTTLFVLKNSPIQWNGDLSSLSPYQFGRVRGYNSGPQFEHLLEKGIIEISVATKTSQNIKKLLAKRFDIMVEERHVVRFELKKMGRIGEIKQLAIIQKNLSYLGFSKKRKRKATIKAFNKILKQMKSDGSYQRIIDDFYTK